MAKKKLDDLTQIKLVYSGELLLFAIVFLVIGLLMICNIWVLSDRFMMLFKWITIFGNTLLIGDLIWILCSPKRRKKNSLLDKFTILPANLYIIVLDILLFMNNESINTYRNLYIPPVIIYFALAYTFQAIYHWYRPLPSLLEELKDSLYLKPLSLENAKAEYHFLSRLEPENGFENDVFGMDYNEYVNNYLPQRISFSKGENLPEGFVADTNYILYNKKVPIGVFKVRHYLNDRLANGAGHIGYAISKDYRGNGYAKKGLKLAIDELIKLPDFKEDEIYMSCNNDNEASLKVQLANGAYIHHKDDKETYTRIKVGK